MHVFFLPEIMGHSVVLSEDESKHCIRVLRMQKGDPVHLADGKGLHALGTVTDDHPKRCVIGITERIMTEKLHDYSLHVLVAPTKNSDRIEWFIEKATEAGIDEITFIETQNSERSKINMERCEKIAVSAMKQSKQWWLPRIHAVTSFTQALQNADPSALRLIAWCETEHDRKIQAALSASSQQNIMILVGPEGDFTAGETGQAKAAGFEPVSLGKSILRTETAALFACMAVKTLRG